MRIKKGFVLREMCGENIITAEGIENVRFDKLISLNATAAYLWNELAGKEFTIEDMADLLVNRYEISKEVASTDSARLAQAWIDAGIAE
jgi:hypothetical protein